ncbi:hypothetical protein Cylst_5428 [Cylindrospermum stagnale PCC 7417]|uniref:Uncharacterized protein n=1 Tax=Cylindrospermum stagnale PCC 7417 TaxID=56107 RepID=K9X5S9_9NOST|nr:hypothetical protein [Cylindrospermum stagnale]AFZ27444.1 hypothetical protein Cylst_5428 [Cylindrospermum stagnale PCC 7417]
MADISFTDKSKIAEIINTSPRLKYLLAFTYQISLDDIVSIRVDGDNFKVDVNTKTDMFRFKPKGIENVIMKNPEIGILQLQFDPALAQGIYNIVDEYVQ